MKKTILESIYTSSSKGARAFRRDIDRLKWEIRSGIVYLQSKAIDNQKEADDLKFLRFLKQNIYNLVLEIDDERFIKQKIENLVLEIKNKTYHEEPIPPREEPKNRSYGNKYIKRKNRW